MIQCRVTYLLYRFQFITQRARMDQDPSVTISSARIICPADSMSVAHPSPPPDSVKKTKGRSKTRSKNHSATTKLNLLVGLFIVLLLFVIVILLLVQGIEDIQTEGPDVPDQPSVPDTYEQPSSNIETEKQPSWTDHKNQQHNSHASDPWPSEENRKQSLIPKQVWIFAGGKMTDHSDQMITINQRHFAGKAGFKISYISEGNYSALLSSEGAARVQKLATLAKVEQGEWIKTLIMLGVLIEKGGVMLFNSDLVLTESLQWVLDTDLNPHVNRGRRTHPAEVVGFYDSRLSSHDSSVKAKDTGEPSTDPLKKLCPYPAMIPAIVAAVPQAEFLKRLWLQLEKSLTDPSYFTLSKIPSTTLSITGKRMGDNFFGFVALRALMAESAKEKDKTRENQRMVATMERYSLSLINGYYGPQKMNKQMPNRGEALWKHTAIMDMKQMIAYFGRFRYCFRFPRHAAVRNQMAKLTRGQTKVVRGSFIHQVLLFDSKYDSYLTDNKQKPVTNDSAPQWDSLPKKVWAIWDSGVKHSKAVHQLALENTRRKVAESGFTLHIVDKENVGTYLDQSVIDKINFAISHPSGRKYPHTWPDMVRIALLYKHGGVYLDSTFILVDNFDWIVNIARYPSQFIYNRFGELPKMLGTFHPWWSTPLAWKIDEKANTKSELTLAPENNFVAAEAGNEFIREWFEAYLDNFQRPYSQTLRDFNSYGVSSHKWTSQGNTYLLSMDSMKMVFCRRNTNLPAGYANAMDYYKAWFVHGYYGYQNYRNDFNLQDPFNQRQNLFLYQYSMEYVRELVGSTPHVLKLYGWDSAGVDNIIMGNYPHNQDAFHPRSFIWTHLLSSNPTIRRLSGGLVEVTFPDAK